MTTSFKNIKWFDELLTRPVYLLANLVDDLLALSVSELEQLLYRLTRSVVFPQRLFHVCQREGSSLQAKLSFHTLDRVFQLVTTVMAFNFKLYKL